MKIFNAYFTNLLFNNYIKWIATFSKGKLTRNFLLLNNKKKDGSRTG